MIVGDYLYTWLRSTAAHSAGESWGLFVQCHKFQLLFGVANWALDPTKYYLFWSIAGRILSFQRATAHNGAGLRKAGRNLLFRLTNCGGPLAVPLPVAVSKPPYGIPGIIGKTNNIDLAEGTIVSVAGSQTAQMFCAVSCQSHR
ncbi:hypothetical protein P171DRAFT_443301 [Karstenula rhodostoma CBS 690.94]|uniref:Uncharacterized protein n=1 Tax=Karstenula rhodostoma CBS 690.94 TaxID=1392251 RepID=A0A9P4UDR6_9PLEO|nr:hypothetical protein P171DRAFT_443301 [Karstenula rhodostoma CBS 690.94]